MNRRILFRRAKRPNTPIFRCRPDYPDFPSRKQMGDYYSALRGHFQSARKYSIQDKSRDVPARTTDESWEVELANGEKRIYKGVIVCNGHHWDKRFPVLRRRIYGRDDAFEGLQNARTAGGKKSSGHRRRKFGLRCRVAKRRASPAEAHLSLAARLLVFAENACSVNRAPNRPPFICRFFCKDSL